MSMTVDQLVNEIRALPHDVMAEVVDHVLFESHGGQNPEHARAWSQTVHRRSVKPHTFHPEADAEYVEAALHLTEHGEQPGGRFYDEIERVIAEIKAAPSV